SNRKPMGFVARLLNHAKSRRTTREAQRLGSADHVDLFLALGKADHGHRGKAKHGERGVCGVELPLAAVDDDEVGERLPFLGPSREVARHDLVHRREVVDPFDGLHLELAILGAIGPAILKPDTGRDGVRSLRVRDVEADEGSRDFLQSELPLQLIYRIARSLLGFFAGETELLEQMPRVLRGEVDELTARTALGRVDLAPLERRFDQIALLGIERHEQLGGTILEWQITADEVRLENGGIGLLLDVLEELVLAREEFSA